MSRIQRVAGGAQVMSGGVDIVPPTAANAERLWRYYQQAYRDDDDLLLRTCSQDLGIDGLTESLTADDLAQSMRMPDTVTFEAAPTEIGRGGGFLIVRYSSRERASRQEFESYLLGDVFRRRDLRFTSSEDEEQFLRNIEYGGVVYFAEFVSAGGRSVSTSLVLAAYNEVCVRRLGATPCTIVGKCLDSVRIGRCANLKGNRPVKSLAESLGLKKIAWCDQFRKLHAAGHSELLERAFPDRRFACATGIDAVLTFALYIGKAQSAAERMGGDLKVSMASAAPIGGNPSSTAP